MTTFTKKFREYLKEEDINDCIECIINVYFSQNNLDKNDLYTFKNIYNELKTLLLEWIDDYVGNIDMDESVAFLNKYGYSKAIYLYNNINIYDYIDNQIAFNRKLISFIIGDYILREYFIYI